MKDQSIILFDDEHHKKLYPLNLTQPVANLRVGVLTIAEKWKLFCKKPVSFLCENYLQQKFAVRFADENIFINGAAIPTENLWDQIQRLKTGEALFQNGRLLAIKSEEEISIKELKNAVKIKKYIEDVIFINRPYDIFLRNRLEILHDLHKLSLKNYEQPLDTKSNIFINEKSIYAHSSAKITGAIINATDGPVYIDKGVQIMEGVSIRGPVAICEGSVIKMGAKIYGSTTIGPYCKIGGEINNVVFHSYSNKAHDGFLGNSVVGSWCNLGADSNCSNLKNNYGIVKTYNYETDQFEDSGLIFHGLIMADHSKCSINTMFNTGTTVGVFANIFGDSFPHKFIPSFIWGKESTYTFEKAMEVAKAVMQRRNVNLFGEDILILKHIFDTYRTIREKHLL